MAEPTTKDLLDDLDQHITHLAAIVDAAKDFVTVKEKIRPMPHVNDTHIESINLAYENLRVLILGEA